MTIAVFDYALWSARYPALVATVNQTQAQAYFDEAGLYCNNTDGSIVPYNPPTDITRLTLLNMLVSHLATLESTARGGAVGRVSQATKGTVTVAFDNGTPSAAEAWFMQTPYGANFWRATARFRRFQYRPGPQRFAQRASIWRR